SPSRLLGPPGGRLFAVGDAAGQCLPLTAEGIRPAIYFGSECGRLVQRVLDGALTLEAALDAYRRLVERYRRPYRMLRVVQWLAAPAPTRWFAALGAAAGHPPPLPRWWPRHRRVGGPAHPPAPAPPLPRPAPGRGRPARTPRRRQRRRDGRADPAATVGADGGRERPGHRLLHVARGDRRPELSVPRPAVHGQTLPQADAARVGDPRAGLLHDAAGAAGDHLAHPRRGHRLPRRLPLRRV